MSIAFFRLWSVWTEVAITEPMSADASGRPPTNGTIAWPTVGNRPPSTKESKGKKGRPTPTPGPTAAPTLPVHSIPPFVHPRDRTRFGATNVLGGEEALYQACIVESSARKHDSSEGNKPVSWNITRQLVLYVGVGYSSVV